MNEFKDFRSNYTGILCAFISFTGGHHLESEGLKDVSYLLFQGNAAAKIVDITQATHDNLVAICTHCRSGIGRWVLGSVTDRVVRHSGNPVLVIRASH